MYIILIFLLVPLFVALIVVFFRWICIKRICRPSVREIRKEDVENELPPEEEMRQAERAERVDQIGPKERDEKTHGELNDGPLEQNIKPGQAEQREHENHEGKEENAEELEEMEGDYHKEKEIQRVQEDHKDIQGQGQEENAGKL